jgi:predicted alpha-1,2-mannosidase
MLLNSCRNICKEEPVKFVNPFIGTGGHGHTFPGATAPFGMVQLSPDTKIDDWDHCSGYHYSDSVILGFSHTHLSGTGIGDYGDIRFMPFTGMLKTIPGDASNPDNGYASRFSHINEKAQPGYYSVYLSDYDIIVELTATERTGLQKYTFEKNPDSVFILLDLKEAVTTENIITSEIMILNNHTVTGYRRTKGWANNHYVFFYTEFSRPFKNYALVINGKTTRNLMERQGKDLKAFFVFDTGKDNEVMVKTGISSVSVEGAKKNMQKEIPYWDFNKTKTETCNKWNSQLSKIIVDEENNDKKTIFYTALYHSMLAPNIFSDVDSCYRGHDNKIHVANDFKMYTVFSLWDTFRALHPLFTIIERNRTVDFIKSMLTMYDADKLLPVWELSANETNCMIGYHSVSVITDAYKKDIRNFDVNKALEAMVSTANTKKSGLQYYITKGYIPSDKESESVSKTLEYAYDDWCIAEMAKMTTNKKVQKYFTKRAQYYKNIFENKTGFFRPKSNGSFTEPFDPKQVNFNYTEANAWQYNFFVPQDINTLIELLGGDKSFTEKLDELFNSSSEMTGRNQADITGLIGQYAHGNEPGHHIPYLYNYAGNAWKTQKKVNEIMNNLYKNTPDGLPGNEDCGQMSAWYVLSALGFYQVTPGTEDYIMGTPLFKKATLKLENGKTFIIEANNRDETNYYIESAKFNDKKYTKSLITNDMIINGGIIEFEMSSKPNKNFGKEKDNRPKRKITDNLIVANPYFIGSKKTFTNSMTVTIDDINTKAKLLYKKNNRKKWIDFENPITIKRTTTFSAKASCKGKESFTEKAVFVKISGKRKVTYNTKYSSLYTAGGKDALINTIRGANDFKTGDWQGFEGNNLDVVIDLGKKQKIKQIGISFLQDTKSWIFMPLWVKFEISYDGKNFSMVGKIKNSVNEQSEGPTIKDFILKNVNKKVRYIHITAKNRGSCPKWHIGYPGKAWIFADEIWID